MTEKLWLQLCIEEGPEHCERSHDCITLPLWQKLDHVINDYLDNVTLEDLIENKIK
ncbi:MAG: hypothetical protein ACLSHN_10265 [Eubacterium sp.]|uniref:hypothetical protein n=1 Tax=Eubacterium sp. TaxID=142586 RepID=UPI0039968D7D